MSELISKIDGRRRVSAEWIAERRTSDLAWGVCGLVPTVAVFGCMVMLTGDPGPRDPADDERPWGAGLTSLHNLFEALVFCERVAIKDPTAELEQIQPDTLKEFEWAVPILDHVVFVPFEWGCMPRKDALAKLRRIVLGVKPSEIRERQLEAWGSGGGLDELITSAYLDRMGAFGRGGDAIDLKGVAQDLDRALAALQDAGGQALTELLDLAVARFVCDQHGMTLWALPEAPYFHLFCLGDPPLSVRQIGRLRAELATMRSDMVGATASPFQAAGPHLHCNVELSPVLLALLREVRKREDLVPVALQFREAAAPFRKHLAHLDECSKESLKALADWRLEWQSICNAVGRALGFKSAGDSLSIGSVVLQCVRGDAAGLVHTLADRAPGFVRRHLLHPVYVGRRRTFVRRLAYDALLSPPMRERILQLFG